MAEYVVVDKDQLETNLTTVADAIRAKCGMTEAMEFPNGFKNAVDGIKTSGSSEDTWVEDNSEVVATKAAYANANWEAHITEGGTLIWKRIKTEYPSHYPKALASNYNQLSAFWNKNTDKYLNVVQAEIVNSEELGDEFILKTLGKSAFACLPNLKRVRMPDTIDVLEDNVFVYNTSLKNISLSDTVTTIGSGCFRCCSSLEKFKIPPKVLSLSSCLFTDCYNLRSVDGIDRMVSIGANAFDNCVQLKGRVTFNEAIEVLESGTFRSCYNLNSLVFKGTPTSIGSGTFQYCPNITDIYVPWGSGEVANAPWGAVNATIHYNIVYDENHNPIIQEV